MDVLYEVDQIPEYVKGGVIMFSMKDRVMSKIKSKVWKTLSHVGILYQSLVSGSPTTWVSYMDEIYGIISAPLHVFLQNPSLVRERGWAIRYIPNFDGQTSRSLNSALMRHTHEDSHLGFDEENRITGSFDDELKSILGVMVTERESPDFNTNLGFVYDVLCDFWAEMNVSQEVKDPRVAFSEEEIAEEDVVRSFYHCGQSGEELMRSVNQLLCLVNLTTHTVTPPIQPLLTKPLPLLDSKLIVPSSKFYQPAGGVGPSTTFRYPMITEERQHVASIISRMFESGLGSEEVREYFEEELETTTLARRGRGQLTQEYTRELVQSLLRQLGIAKEIIERKTVPTRTDKERYNQQLQELLVCEGSLLVHLEINDVKIPIDKLRIV